MVSFALPDDYYSTLLHEIEAVSLEDVRRVARENTADGQLTLLVVGDMAVAEARLRGLGFPVRMVDHDGREVPGRAVSSTQV